MQRMFDGDGYFIVSHCMHMNKIGYLIVLPTGVDGICIQIRYVYAFLHSSLPKVVLLCSFIPVNIRKMYDNLLKLLYIIM